MTDELVETTTDGAETAPETSETPDAPPPPEGEVPAEKAPEDDEEAKGKKVDALLDGIKRREKAQVERASKLAAQQADFKQQVAQFDAQRDAHTRDRQQFESIRQQAVSIIEESKRDPIAWLQRAHGITPEDIARRVLNGGAPSPEELIRTGQTELQKVQEEIRKLREDKTREEQVRSDQRERESFVRMVRGDEGLKSYVTKLGSDEAILDEAYVVAHLQARKLGRVPSHDEVARAMLERYKLYGTPEQAQRADAAKEAAQAAPQAPESGDGPQGGRAEATAGPALTNRATAKRASAPVDIVALELSDPDAARRYILDRVK